MATVDRAFLQEMLHQVMDFVYPAQCEMCRVPLHGGKHLCPDCSGKLPRIREPFCSRCGEMFEGNISSEFTCPNCSKLEYDFAFCRPVLTSTEPARELIHSLKYAHAIHLSKDLANLAAEAFLDPRLQIAREQAWTLIPIPLHWRREQSRHFNQAREMVKHLSAILHLPWCDVLQRTRATTTQTALNRRQRLKNLKGSISISRAGRHWLAKKPTGAILFDDVFTTGATAQECSAVLRKAGIENRVVVTLMRG
jgi:competence protein ComFC